MPGDRADDAVHRPYFDEIMTGLQTAGVDVQHFALVASPDTLRDRLRTRSGYWIGRLLGREELWAMQQIDRCVTALADPAFAQHINTDNLTVHDAVENLAALAGLRLSRPRLHPARYQLRRLAVGVRHIRV